MGVMGEQECPPGHSELCPPAEASVLRGTGSPSIPQPRASLVLGLPQAPGSKRHSRGQHNEPSQEQTDLGTAVASAAATLTTEGRPSGNLWRL